MYISNLHTQLKAKNQEISDLNRKIQDIDRERQRVDRMRADSEEKGTSNISKIKSDLEN